MGGDVLRCPVERRGSREQRTLDLMNDDNPLEHYGLVELVFVTRVRGGGGGGVECLKASIGVGL